jgi:hypothetical protein
MLSSFSLDKAESSPPSVHYYITDLLPTYCRKCPKQKKEHPKVPFFVIAVAPFEIYWVHFGER